MPPRKKPPPSYPGELNFQTDTASLPSTAVPPSQENPPQTHLVTTFSLNNEPVRSTRAGKAVPKPGQHRFTSKITHSPSPSSSVPNSLNVNPDRFFGIDSESSQGVIQMSQSPENIFSTQSTPVQPNPISPLQLTTPTLSSPDLDQHIVMQDSFLEDQNHHLNHPLEPIISPTNPSLFRSQPYEPRSLNPTLSSPVSLSSGPQDMKGSHANLSKALEHLRLARISLARLILLVLDGECSDPHLRQLRNQFLREDFGNVAQILDALWADEKGRVQLQAWMIDREAAVEVISNQVTEEFKSAKHALYMKSSQITIPYIQNWDVSDILDTAPTPIFTRILRTAMDEDRKYESESSERAIKRIKIVPS
ncbi:hypothetical protein K435DRAFT_794514 [Dendrothele bispora CBS 962.96]|uniref:Uncharacterized protein n=1 Tax=Dendrothele bispora (strain CBS 962.96) TaxID=1314807 RepID=A0A4S8MBN5_DENBC|nr:hypothetical protein K435DRAFT_794514 [Dendrothele bispora CBS 962.96]